MKKHVIFTLSTLTLMVFLLNSCKKADILGPEYVAVPAGFTVNNGDQFEHWTKVRTSTITSQSQNVSHATRDSYFKASFSHKVTWKITLSSVRNPAVRVLTGIDQVLDSTNTKWDGGGGNGYFFDDLDTVAVALSFIGTDKVIRDTIYLSTSKEYDYTIDGVKYTTVDDFDNNGIGGVKFSSFYPDLADEGGGNVGNRAYKGHKVQGKYSYRMYGTDLNNNTYLGSANTETAATAINDFPAGTFTTTNPDEMYLNMYIYGTGRPSSTVNIIAFENDADQVGGTLDQTINDKWTYPITVSWTGWKLVSFRYSGFKKTNTGAGLGNNRLTPNKLCGFALELDSSPIQGLEVEAYVDMFVITEGGPFKQ